MQAEKEKELEKIAHLSTDDAKNILFRAIEEKYEEDLLVRMQKMETSNFIKVTPRGEKNSVVVLSTTESFHLSQGAKVEKATEKEIIEFFPEFRKEKSVKDSELKAQVKELEAQITDLKTQIEKVSDELKVAKTENSEQKEAYEAQITDLKTQIENLNK